MRSSTSATDSSVVRAPDWQGKQTEQIIERIEMHDIQRAGIQHYSYLKWRQLKLSTNYKNLARTTYVEI